MQTLENLFSKKNEIVKQLQKNIAQVFYKKEIFEHLGPELRKIFYKKKDKISYKNFYEAAQYEYGFFDKEIDLLKAYLLYKKYADRNDYLCMYKMHVIYLCEYKKFHVPFSRVLEKIYLLKCYAYLPNYIENWNLNLFEKIDLHNEISEMLALEDESFEKHEIFFELLIKERILYNLTENDVYLMKGITLKFFEVEDVAQNSLSFSTLISLVPKTQIDYAYYHAKIKGFQLRNKENIVADSEIEKFYKEIENKKLYEFFMDYGEYLLNKNEKLNQKVIEIFTIGVNKGYSFCNIGIYHSLIHYYDFFEIITNNDNLVILLDCMLDTIIFEKLLWHGFILLMGLIIKYNKFSKNIASKYLIYIKEINDYITPIIKRRERLKPKEKESMKKNEYIFFHIKAYIYYFGFKGIEEQNLKKAIECFDEVIDNDGDIRIAKIARIFKYKIKQILNNRKLISNEELIKTKKDLYKFNLQNKPEKGKILDYYLLAKDYFEGITLKKDEFIAFKLYELAQHLHCKDIFDCYIKNKIKEFLNNHKDKYEINLKDEICCICYTEKVDILIIPCKHNFCLDCIKKLEKCPICRSTILNIFEK